MDELIEIIMFLKQIKASTFNWKSEFDEFLNRMTSFELQGISEEIKRVVQRYIIHFDLYVENPEWRAHCEDYYGEEKLLEHIDNFFSELKASGVDVDNI